MVMRMLSPLALLSLCLTARLPAAGELDTSFNPNVDGEIKALALDPDGKILIGGSFSSVGGKQRPRIARLLATGQLDANWAPPAGNAVPACAVLGDGSVVAGASFPGHVGICRLLPDGSIDPSYLASVGEGEVHAMGVDIDGNLLLGGNFDMINGRERGGFAVLGADGIERGKYYADPDGGKSVNSLLARADRSTILGGDFGTLFGRSSAHLGKMSSGAILDSSYRSPFIVADGKSVNCLALQNYEIPWTIAGGNFSTKLVGGVPESRCLARISSTGVLDSTFNPVFTQPNGVPKVTSVVVQTNGKMIVAGDFTSVNGVARQGLVRLTQSGTVDTSFVASAAGATGLALQADGKLLVTGTFQQVNGVTRNRIARLIINDLGRESFAIRQDRITWTRIGQESELVSFEVSSDGATWQTLKAPTRTSSSFSPWISSGLSLPAAGVVRARARVSSGIMNGSSGIVERRMDYVLFPNLSVREERTPNVWFSLKDGQTTPIDYGDLDQGSPRIKRFEIFNGGTMELNVAGVQLPPGFDLVDPPVFPVKVGVQVSLILSIRADAGSLGAIGGTAMVASDDPDTPSFDFPLTGIVGGPDITMHLGDAEVPSDGTEPISFAPGYQGTQQVRKTLTISNSGNRDLDVNSISAGVGFTVDAPLPFSLHPGESREIQVGPDQSIAGSLNGNLEVFSNDADEPLFRVPLAARVLNPLVTKVVNTRTTLDRKRGLRLQKLRITNPTKTAAVAGFRVIVRGLPEWVQVRNASEILPDGSVVIEIHHPLGPSGKFNLVLEYEIPKDKPAVVFPALTTEVILNIPEAAGSAALAVEKCERDCEGHFAVTFRSVPGRLYQVEYSADGKVWKASTPTRAAGSVVRWLDCGCPHTECAPAEVSKRFYRVRELE